MNLKLYTFLECLIHRKQAIYTQRLKKKKMTQVCVFFLPAGDVLLITAFVSYVGSFTKTYRVDLMDKMWLPFMKAQKVQYKQKFF